MAKYATRRSYKKCASKKRHTIRKLKRTLRRKMQRGGGPQEDAALFNAVFPLIQTILPGVFKLLMNNLGPLLQIFILLGNAGLMRGGSKTRLAQRGGGLSQAVKTRLISKLNELKANFEGINDLIKCIDTLIAKFEQEPVDPTAVDLSPEAEAETIDLSVVQKELTEEPAPTSDVPEQVSESRIDKFKRIFNENVVGTLNRKIEKLRKVFTPEELGCLITLKEAIILDFKTKIDTTVADIKQKPLVMSAINGLENLKNAVSGKVTDLKDAATSRIDAFNNSERGQQLAAKKETAKEAAKTYLRGNLFGRKS